VDDPKDDKREDPSQAGEEARDKLDEVPPPGTDPLHEGP
jgi:hypothetical protein